MSNLPTQNNNPGDLRNVGQQGATQGAGGFAAFSSPQAGYGALLNDIQSKINTHPDWTLGDFSNTYAPPSDGNNSAQYTANLANQLGVAPNAKISSLQPEIGKFAEAIAQNEGYQNSSNETIGNSQSTSPSSNTSFSPADIGLGLVGAGAAALPTIWNYAQKPLVDAGVDAATGAVLGAPEGGIGAIPGAIGGAVVGIGQGIFQDIVGGGNSQQTTPPSDTSSPSSTPSDTIQSTPSTPGPTSAVPSEAQTLINDSINGDLNRTVGGRTLSQSPEGQLGVPTMAENGYVPANNNGNADYSSALAHSQSSVAQAAGIEKQAAGGSTVPMAEVLATARQNIKDSNVAPDIKQETLDKLDKISSSYGEGDISGSDAIEARHQQYATVGGKNWAKLSSSEIEARKALGTAFRDTALNHSNNRDLQRAAIFEQQKHISAQKVMKKLHNHPISKQDLHPFRRQLYKAAATLAEAYIGEKIGGTLGAVLGYAVGSQINGALEKKLKKTHFDTPEMKKALETLQDTKPGAYNHFKEVLKRNGIDIPETYKSSDPKDTTKEVKEDVVSLKKDVEKYKGKSTGFPAKEEKKEPSDKLKSLMQRGNVPSKGLMDLKKGLPINQRKGTIKGLVSLKR